MCKQFAKLMFHVDLSFGYRKWCSKDEYNIYFLMDFACGGELFSYLRKAGKFNLSTCKFLKTLFLYQLFYVSVLQSVMIYIKKLDLYTTTATTLPMHFSLVFAFSCTTFMGKRDIVHI